MASVLIITTILNIVVSVFVNSEKQSSQRLSNSQLQHNDQKGFDRRMDTISGWNQLKREQPNSNMLKNQPLNKRKKRQILFLVNRRPVPEALFRMPKTTQNPFIRETNVDEYDIGGPAEIEHVPQAGDSSSRIDSHQLVSETSELEYESGYTISMSDSEDWENYPLTTPSGPNPGWRLSTLADIYQRQRVKRSPKEKKRKIGAYKEKLKERRKRKEIRRKMRIIRNSKEDKEVKEHLMKHEGDEEVEKLLAKPWYKQQRVKKDSKHVLWSNETHRIVEDQGATFKWINKTHYAIYKENVTDNWYDKEHVLVYDEDWDSNNTSIEKHEGPSRDTSGNPKVDDANYSEGRSENLTKEEEASKANDKRKKNQNSKQNKTKKKSNLKKQKISEDRDVKRKEQGDKKDASSKNTSKISLGWENQIVDESES